MNHFAQMRDAGKMTLREDSLGEEETAFHLG